MSVHPTLRERDAPFTDLEVHLGRRDKCPMPHASARPHPGHIAAFGDLAPITEGTVLVTGVALGGREYGLCS